MEFNFWEEDSISYCQGMLELLINQRNNKVDGNIYKAMQCDMAYNSNKIEGSQLSHDQTVLIFDRGAIDGYALINDALETSNHFTLFDRMLDDVGNPINIELICEYQSILMGGTDKARNPIYSVGALKKFDNFIGIAGGEVETAPVEKAEEMLCNLCSEFNNKQNHSLDELLDFHVRFEQIHPLSDGNGRVGRILLMKGCLENNLMPFIFTDKKRAFYLRGLRNWHEERGWLRDTALTAQDEFIATYYPLAASYAQAIQKIKQPAPAAMKEIPIGVPIAQQVQSASTPALEADAAKQSASAQDKGISAHSRKQIKS